MPSVKNLLIGAYYVGKLLSFLLWALIYLRWSMWRAKRSFAGELKEQGVPEIVASELARSYNEQNKRFLSDLMKLRSYPHSPR